MLTLRRGELSAIGIGKLPQALGREGLLLGRGQLGLPVVGCRCIDDLLPGQLIRSEEVTGRVAGRLD